MAELELTLLEFKELLYRAGATPRDIVDVLGIHASTTYRILSLSEKISKHSACSIKTTAKFLKWFLKMGFQVELNEVKVRDRRRYMSEKFGVWLIEE